MTDVIVMDVRQTVTEALRYVCSPGCWLNVSILSVRIYHRFFLEQAQDTGNGPRLIAMHTVLMIARR